jgi:hypothetical protein
MKLIVPYTGEMQGPDARLIRLAEFLGLRTERVRLAKGTSQPAEYLNKAITDRDSCLVIHPNVMRDWIGGDVLPAELVHALVSLFPRVFVHALTPDPHVQGMVADLSGGKLQSVLPIGDAGEPYEISSDSRDICGPFSGLSFGPVNRANDHVFAFGTDDVGVRKLISIGNHPSMAVIKRDKTEILFIASEDIADVDAEIGRGSIRDYFSRLVPHAMALRYIFGEECWRPSKSHASVIIDDPLLRRNYGYLNFESLLRLTKEYNFHTTISFIPYNYRRNSARIAQMFRENSDRLSICFHGNDHAKAELGSTDSALLNRVLSIAEERMKVHEQATGLHCDRVMVFPQDNYSVEAMQVLKSRNFHAASSSPRPVGKSVPLRIADFAQPAILRYGGMPLFIRSFIKDIESQDIAFSLFFGRPVLIGEHHDIFKRPRPLLELVQKINSIAPGISWSSLETLADNSTLKRRTPDGIVQIRPYSRNVVVANDSASAQRFSVEWSDFGRSSSVEQVLRDGERFPDVEVEFDDTGIRASVELAPGASQIFSLVYRNDYAITGKPGFMWDAQMFLRRRLSEVRDNYLSKNQHLMTAAKALQHRFLK